MTPLPLGSVIGILGAGQLGRMLAAAAARLGYVPKVYAPDEGPAMQVAVGTVGPWDGPAVDAFLSGCAVVTYESENTPLRLIDRAGSRVRVLPNRRALEVASDRLREKDFLAGLGIGTARYRDVKDATKLDLLRREIGPETILKTRRMGYDGKGQVRLGEGGDDGEAIKIARRGSCILEQVVPFDFETSVIAARGLDGAVACYDMGENRHEGGILRETVVPGRVTSALAGQARDIATRIVEALGYVGVMGVEFFVADGRLLVNELAPRVHNSGHWTEAVCAVDQFERHIRAIAGLPLGDGARTADATMTNLIGPEGLAAVPEHLAAPGTRLHLYGKAEARAGRKMGHVTRVTS